MKEESNSGIYCCGCSEKVIARLTDGAEIYPHRHDLHDLPFWICDTCKNYVGCHHRSNNKTKPLGCIPTKEIKNARMHIHELLDPIWKSGKISRKDLYAMITHHVGWSFHTAKIRTIDEARMVYKFLKDFIKTPCN